MEINITHLIDADLSQYSGSIAELGHDAGRYTWENCLVYSKQHPLLGNEASIKLAKRYLATFGASWDLDNMLPSEVEALVFQLIAGDIREYQSFDSYEEFQKASEDGQVSGHIYKSDISESFYYYLGE